MNDLASRLLEEIAVHTVFTLRIGSLEIAVAESTVVSWIIIGALAALSLFFTHDLKVRNPSRRQLMIESFVTWIDNFIESMIGEEAKQYATYMAVVLMYIMCANSIGLFGMKPPTKDLNQTVALAFMSIVLVEAAGIRKKGVKGWLKSFSEPVAAVTPINILELVIRPLSLCMRLFGNILGAYIIMELIKMVIPVAVPLALGFYFDIFDGAIQAYVFVFLTCLYIKEAVE